MDPVSMVVTALAAGASSRLKDASSDAVKTAYMRLKDLAMRRLASQPDGEFVLSRYESAPEKWTPLLVDELSDAGAERDGDLLAAARELLVLVDQAGARAGKYAVTIQGSKGVQIGDHNTQTNTFN